MRVKIVASLVALFVFVFVAVGGYIGVLGIEVDATAENLTADWLSNDHTTAINLKDDGTFAANDISRCIGDVGLKLDDSMWPTDLTVEDGEGTWHVEPNDTGDDHFLIMNFRSPRPFQMRWQVGPVIWQFRPTEVIVVSLNPPNSMDGSLARCSLQSR